MDVVVQCKDLSDYNEADHLFIIPIVLDTAFNTVILSDLLSSQVTLNISVKSTNPF